MDITVTITLTEDELAHLLGHTEGDYCAVCKAIHEKVRAAVNE